MDTEHHQAAWDQPLYVVYHRRGKQSTVTLDDIEHAISCNYDMLTCTVTNDHFHARVLTQLAAREGQRRLAIPPLTNLDTNIEPGPVAQRVVAYASSWIDICSPDPLISDLSQQVLGLEVAYAAFCGVEYLVISGPRTVSSTYGAQGLACYARAIQEALSTGAHVNILLEFNMMHSPLDIDNPELGDLSAYARSDSAKAEQGDHGYQADTESSTGFSIFDSWESWHVVRSLCSYSQRLSVALSIPQAASLKVYDKRSLSRVQDRWYSEPVKAVSLRPESFVNTSGHETPELPNSVQSLLSRLMRVKLGPWVVLEDVDPLPSPESLTFDDHGHIHINDLGDPTSTEPDASKYEAKDEPKWPFLHLEYIRYFQNRQPPRSVVERYGSGYQDYLQVPLQPLTDNLESVTYEVFEKDPVKYELYEEALRLALRDWSSRKLPASGPEDRVVVAVAGAGRGPLVTRAIRASEAENVPIDLWAVEKNPNAFVHLHRINTTVWSGQVTIEKSDMRSWRGPWRSQETNEADPSSSTDGPVKAHYAVDILVSELLGSFGDNELSPECLDGVIRLLAPDGISIPRSYTAFLTPIAAPKLHADILARKGWDPTAPETPSVVWLHAIDYLSVVSNQSPRHPLPTEDPLPTTLANPYVEEAWVFHHSPSTALPHNTLENSHNTRFTRLDFDLTDRAVCHGFGGYFESVLYPGVELSTHPNTMEKKSPAMISWFPIFFPVKSPIYSPDNSRLSITMWRQTDGRKVWYEWVVETWTKGDSNAQGPSLNRLSTSELHSSVKNGCLM